MADVMMMSTKDLVTYCYSIIPTFLAQAKKIDLHRKSLLDDEKRCKIHEEMKIVTLNAIYSMAGGVSTVLTAVDLLEKPFTSKQIIRDVIQQNSDIERKLVSKIESLFRRQVKEKFEKTGSMYQWPYIMVSGNMFEPKKHMAQLQFTLLLELQFHFVHVNDYLKELLKNY